MPARETEAIILKTFALGEADRLVSFLGRTSGRMRGVAAGARRIKNRYGSTLELLAHVQLWYVERETRDLVRIQQAELLESFNKSQSDYELSTSLALVSETVELVLPEHEPSEPMFRLILLTVRELSGPFAWPAGCRASMSAPNAASPSARSRRFRRPGIPASSAKSIAAPA